MPDPCLPEPLGPESFLDSREPRPWLRVTEIAEFTFCPRAGMLARLHADDEPETDDQPPRLGYLPGFDIAELRRSLDRASSEVVETLWLIGGEVVLIIVLDFLASSILALLALASLPYSIMRLVRQTGEVVRLLRCLRLAQQTRAVEPPLPLHGTVPVHWWALLNAGFSPVEYLEAHRHGRLAVAGRPWRVLHRGSLRIPVFRKRYGAPEIHDQHLVRIAAYCCLVEECELVEAPYGIVLFGDGYDGVAVPVCSRYRQQFLESLEAARAQVECCGDKASRRLIEPPESLARCAGCHWGFPQIRTPEDVTRNNVLPESERGLITRGRNSQLYGSPCGDLFRWVPPHEKANDLRLL